MVDIALKHQPSKLFVRVSDAFFDEEKRRPWHAMRPVCGKYELWTGYAQSVLMTSSGAMVQVSTAGSFELGTRLPNMPLVLLRVSMRALIVGCLRRGVDSSTPPSRPHASRRPS